MWKWITLTQMTWVTISCWCNISRNMTQTTMQNWMVLNYSKHSSKWKVFLQNKTFLDALLIIFAWFWWHSTLDSQNYYIAIWVKRQVWFGNTVQISLVWESSVLCHQNHAKIFSSVNLNCSISNQKPKQDINERQIPWWIQ